MPSHTSNFAKLASLEGETSSDKRRDLLRQMMDALLANGHDGTETDLAQLDEIMSAAAADLKLQVRAALALSVSVSPVPLRHTARLLALDDIEVARPIIERSCALSQSDLLDVVTQKSQAHMLAMTKRADIGEQVSGALVERGEDCVVASLLENTHAKIDRVTYEKVADRAQGSAALHAPFVRRRAVPLDLLNDLYLKVEAELRHEILNAYQSVSPEELNAALALSRKRVAKVYSAEPEEQKAERRDIEAMAQRGELKPPILVRLLREAKRGKFLFAFAKLAGVGHEFIDRMVQQRDLDVIATLCRATGFDRALFVTIAMMIAGQTQRMANAEEYGEIYEKVPVAAAQRAVRFWKLRDNL